MLSFYPAVVDGNPAQPDGRPSRRFARPERTRPEMPTLTPERLDEVAAAWRRGLDVDEHTNPAGPRLGDDQYAVYDITMTGSTPATECTILTGSFDPSLGACYCCRIE
jgi:hypothetical protein